MSQKNRVKDPHRPATPNILYFQEFVPATGENLLSYNWVLKNGDGIRIGSSCGIFSTKNEVVRNAIAVMGKEIWAGYHVVDDRDYYVYTQEVGVMIENGEVK